MQTFSSVMVLFTPVQTFTYQIYSIHILIDDVMTPVIHAFLPGNSQATYTRFFTLIKDKIADLGLVFSPTSTIEDFETAVHNSIREVFPDINTKGCFFNFPQSIWRKAQVTGLQIPYRDDDNVKTLVRRAAILLLIHLASAEDVWLQDLEDQENTDITRLTQSFTDNVTDQWVEGDRSLWNHYGTEGPRTTNSIEGWHRKLKKMTQHAHPNIHSLSRVVVPATLHNISVNSHFTRFL
jgi:hypothetical protein